MKLRALLVSGLIASAAMAGNWYVGVSTSIGGNDTRTYDNGYSTVDIDADETDISFRVGKITNGLNRIEFEFNSMELKNKNNSSDKNKLNGYNLNFIIGSNLLKSWNLVPYFKAGLGYWDNKDLDGGTNGIGGNVGVGVYYEVISHVEISAEFLFRAIAYDTQSDVTATDKMYMWNIGANYKF